MFERVIAICLLVSLLFCLIAFSGKGIFRISLVQTAMFVIATDEKKNKTPKKWINILSLVLAFSLIEPICVCGVLTDNTANDYTDIRYI